MVTNDGGGGSGRFSLACLACLASLLPVRPLRGLGGARRNQAEDGRLPYRKCLPRTPRQDDMEDMHLGGHGRLAASRLAQTGCLPYGRVHLNSDALYEVVSVLVSYFDQASYQK